MIGHRASIICKLEKPSAIDCLEEIVALSDAVMVARGDLGVELPAEQVPAIQKRIVRSCRRNGKPVVIATQMLESMIEAASPTRAEASDVATAIYDGADAVMLSAESAIGKHPVAAVAMMNRIIDNVESDPAYRNLIDASHSMTRPSGDVSEAICSSMRHAVALLQAATIVCYTNTGRASLLAARERPEAPIMSLTPSRAVARRLAVVWGVHSVCIESAIADADWLMRRACEMARHDGFASAGQMIVAIAGMPLSSTGTTNFMRIASV